MHEIKKKFSELLIAKVNKILDFLIYFKNGRPHLRTKIIFVLPANHAISLFRLFKVLEKKNIRYLVIAHNFKIQDKLKLIFLGIKFISRESLKDKSFQKKTHRLSEQVKKRWQKTELSKVNLVRNSEKREFLKKALEFWTEEFLRFNLARTLIDLFIAKKVVDKYSPNLLVSTTDPDSKVLPFIKAAKLNKIQTVTIQHGAFVQNIGVDFRSDKILVWGNHYKDWFIESLNKKKSQIVVCGSPFFDNFKLKQFTKALSISKDNCTVLFLLSNSIFFSWEKTLQHIIDELIKSGIKTIFIRPHPWQKITLKAQTNVVLASKKDLDYYIETSDIVVTMNTTAGLIALFCGKPMIYWRLKGAGSLPFGKAGIAETDNYKEIIKLVALIRRGEYKFSERKRQVFIKQLLYKLDGLSSWRVADTLIGEAGLKKDD